MKQALLQSDYPEFLKYIDPDLVEANGGEANMISILKEGKNELRSMGDSIMNVTFPYISKIIKNKNELQCTISQILTMKVPKGKLLTKSSLIGISKDNGNRWLFIDCAGRDIDELIIKMPNLSKDLKIEKELKPFFFRDQ